MKSNPATGAQGETRTIEGPSLHIVATPIGNLEDFTFRAVRILKEADLILSEDTRKTKILLDHYGISTPMKSYRVHRIQEDTDYALNLLREVKRLALTTDAGTPGISDPGSHLVRAVRDLLPDVAVLPIPGASALGAALSICGWQTNPALFGGFLSVKPGRRRRFLEEWVDFEGVIVLYESVHRIEKVLLEIGEIFPDRTIFVAREITKYYEDYRFLGPAGSSDHFQEEVKAIPSKGEFTLVIGPPGRKPRNERK